LFQLTGANSIAWPEWRVWRVLTDDSEVARVSGLLVEVVDLPVRTEDERVLAIIFVLLLKLLFSTLADLSSSSLALVTSHSRRRFERKILLLD